MQQFEGDAQALLCSLKEFDPTFGNKPIRELIEEIKHLLPALRENLYMSISGTKDSPIYIIGGCKDRPTQFVDEQVPDLDKIAAKKSIVTSNRYLT